MLKTCCIVLLAYAQTVLKLCSNLRQINVKFSLHYLDKNEQKRAWFST